MDSDNLVPDILQGKTRSLARAITLLESQDLIKSERGMKIVNSLTHMKGSAVRLGISGPPGCGKSTFIESFGMYLIKQNYKVAVLAVDPSSPINSGSILGDRTRMSQLSSHKNSFIRPSPAGSSLGGVASRTHEAADLCEAAGYDVVIIETVGVGQSEYLVRSMVDLFICIQQPMTGDHLQGIKKGILEIADLIVVNKADGPLLDAAKMTKLELESSINLVKNSHTQKGVYLVSSIEKTGIVEIFSAIWELFQSKEKQGTITENREQQSVKWFERETLSAVRSLIKSKSSLFEIYASYEKHVKSCQSSARQAASEFVRNIISEDYL